MVLCVVCRSRLFIEYHGDEEVKSSRPSFVRHTGKTTSSLVPATTHSSWRMSDLTSTRAKSRKNRVYEFRDFLLKTYGLEYLRQGVVLDVAGGKGDLSWLLQNVDQVESVVLDPRTTTSQHLIRSVEYLRTHPHEAELRSVPDLPTFQPLAKLVKRLPSALQVPQHLCIFVNQELVDAVARYRESGDFHAWCRYFTRAVALGVQANPFLGYTCNMRTSEQGDHETLQSLSSEEVRDAKFALKTILNTCLVVGFHPDQAVDACLDLAGVLNVPFCVVPCCVFPKEFPHRRVYVADDQYEVVRTYSQLIQYLSQKAPSDRAELDFFNSTTSRNSVLYSQPLTSRT